MFMPALLQTPAWVYALFATLIALGLSQMRTRQIGIQRASMLPLIMLVLSLTGTTSAFNGSLQSLASWTTSLVLSASLIFSRALPRGTTYNTTTQRFTLPGSVVPLALMMGIFFTKYAVGVSLSVQPGLLTVPAYANAASAASGLFSGLFLGRGARLWGLALRSRS
jgi:hypothetical protein